MEKLMNSKNIHIAQIRRFGYNHRGNLSAEIPSDIEAYAFLLEKDGEYINILDPMEDYPVYERRMRSNFTLDWEEYGSGIVLISGEEQLGPIYLLEKYEGFKILRKKQVSYEELRNYVINNRSVYFPALENIINEMSAGERLKYLKVLEEEREKRRLFEKYLFPEEDEKNKEYYI